VLALVCHALVEPAVALSPRDWLLIVVAGAGPLGAAFFFWDAALKRSDPRRIGLLSYLTPLASTLLLAATTGRTLTPSLMVATLLIVGAALVGLRTR
jgi:drug/metabolite transporter (DMT)-like permease